MVRITKHSTSQAGVCFIKVALSFNGIFAKQREEVHMTSGSKCGSLMEEKVY